MNEQERLVEEAGTHIWLHYATTVTIGGRTHSFEMGIPVPLGADDALREQLLREANAGMNQLVGSVENRVAQLLQRVQPTQGAIPTPMPAAKPSVAPPPRPRPTTASPSSIQPTSPTPSTVVTPPAAPPVTPPYNASATSSTPQAREVKEVREAREARENREIRETKESDNEQEREVAQPEAAANGQVAQPVQPVRQNIGVSLPSTGEISGNLSLPQFIRYIDERLGLTPKQAMEILKVKSLSGINLRDALEQLQRAQRGANEGEGAEGTNEKGRTGSTDPSLRVVNSANSQRAERVEQSDERPSKPETRNAPQQPSSKQPIPIRPGASDAARGDKPSTPSRTLRESPSYFDEEDDEGDIENELDELLDDGDEDEPRGLSPQERVLASSLVNRLRESQGAALVNPARLKVLSNVTSGQLEEEQLLDLIQGVWNIPSTKRLKVDQAEALISWAKEDDFQSEAELVLMFLEEDALARGNR